MISPHHRRHHAQDSQKYDIPEELLERLLAQVDDPKELLGSGGLLRSLMGRLVEKSLDVEGSDADGHPSDALGGTDCDDEDPTVHLGAIEVCGDGVDQD